MGFFQWLIDLLNQEKDAAFYENGMKLMSRKEFTKASFEFIEAINIKPTDEKYHDAYGKAIYKNGSHAEADAAFSIADDLKKTAQDPTDVKTLCRLAKAFQNKRMFAVSQNFIKKALTMDPNNDQIYFLMGRASYLVDKFQEAIGQYEKALQINPYCVDAYKGLGEVHNSQGRQLKLTEFEELTKFVQEVNKSPDDPNVHANLGDAFRKHANNDLAEVEYTKAIGLSDKCEKALLGLGMLSFNKKDYPNAKKIFYSAIAVNKYNPDSHSYLGLIYQLDPETRKEADWERALARQLKEVAKGDNQTKAYTNLGDFFLTGKAIDDAEDAYLKALKINSNSPEIYVKLALLYGIAKKPREAVDYSEQAIKLAPEQDVGYIGKGRVLMEMDDLNGAIQCFQEALTYSSKSAEAHGFLGEAYKKKGLYQLADKEIRIMGTIQSGADDII